MILRSSTQHIWGRKKNHLCQFPLFQLWCSLWFNTVLCMSIFATVILKFVEGKVLLFSFIISKGILQLNWNSNIWKLVPQIVLKSETEKDAGREKHPCYAKKTPPCPICQFCIYLCAICYSLWYKNLDVYSIFRTVFNNIPCCPSSHTFNLAK